MDGGREAERERESQMMEGGGGREGQKRRKEKGSNDITDVFIMRPLLLNSIASVNEVLQHRSCIMVMIFGVT